MDSEIMNSQWIVEEVDGAARAIGAVAHKRVWRMVRTDVGEYAADEVEFVLTQDWLEISDNTRLMWVRLGKKHLQVLYDILQAS